MAQQLSKNKPIWRVWMKQVASWPWQKIRWRISLLIADLVSLGIFFFYPLLWNQHAGFILLNAASILILFVLHLHKKFWGKHRWIAMSAVFAILGWINITWAQSTLSMETLENLQLYTSSGSSLVFHVAYPRQILYDTTEVPPIALWMDCPTKKCTDIEVKLSSDNENLQFSVKSDAPIWGKTLSILLPGDGSETIILLLRPALIENQVAKLEVLTTAASYPIEKISLEGALGAKLRNFWLSILGTSSVVMALIAAGFAGLKQIDEQKRGEQKKRIDNFIFETQEYKYERGKAQGFLEDSFLKLNDWDDWQLDQQNLYQTAFLHLIDKIRRNGVSQEIFSSEPSLWNKPAQQITEKIQCPDSPAILEKLNQHAPGYSGELCASRFPPEKYPLQRRFIHQGASTLQTTSWGVKDWQMFMTPFGDNAHPFRYVQDGEFPLLGSINFSFDENRFNHQVYYFQNSWDLRTGYHQYCRAFNFLIDEHLRELSRQTFFVPVIADEIPLWAEDISLEEHVLHNLAAAWLRLLASNPGIADEVSFIQVEAIGRLLAWHYGSAAAIQSISLPFNARILQHIQAIKPEKTLSRGDKTGFLSLRPPGADQTLYLCAEVSPAGKQDNKMTYHFSGKLPKTFEAENIHIARFLLAAKKEQAKSLKMCDNELQKLLDERIRLSNAGTLQTFDGLFYPQPTCEDLMRFIARANGSPGTIIQMAHNLIERHIQQSPNIPDISPEALLE